MRRVSKKDVEKVRNLDLLTYLMTYYPDELYRVGKGYKIKTHSSLYISNGLWMYYRDNIGGKSALDYLTKVEGYEFLEAVHHILNITNGKLPNPVKIEPAKEVPFKLPIRNYNNNKIINYLCNERMIDREVVDFCIEHNILYEDRYDHSCVFVGYDEYAEAKFATKRAIDSSVKKDISGSKKEYSFSIANKEADILHVFEASIDLLSYMTILKHKGEDFKEDSYLSLSGVSAGQSPTLKTFIENNPNIRCLKLHLDNDEAGKRASKEIRNKYDFRFYIIDQPPPKEKDFNEYLKYLVREDKLKSLEKKSNSREVR